MDVTDEQYAALYLAEVASSILDAQAYASREHGHYWHVRSAPLTVKGDDKRIDLWRRYADGYPNGLVAMNPDGTWRPWAPDELEGREYAQKGETGNGSE